VVEQIDKFRILNEYQDDLKKNPKLEAMKGRILDKLSEKLQSCMSITIKKSVPNLRDSFPSGKKIHQSSSLHKPSSSPVEEQQTIPKYPPMPPIGT
jgi:hypothetical protein